MQWFNEPRKWEVLPDGSIEVTTDPKTDFWRITHYDFIRDNGHFYYEEVEGDFRAEVKVTGQYKDLYDQAGLMVRLDEANWLKCGIEYVDEIQHISAVNTREFSDWSVTPLSYNPPSIYLRVTREGTALQVHYSFNASDYTLLRLGYMKPGQPLMVGLLVASPDGTGFQVKFDGFSLTKI